MRTIMRITTGMLLSVSVFFLMQCSDPGSNYVGTWVMRDEPITISIIKEGNTFQVTGFIAFQGAYVLDDKDRLVNHSMKNTRLEYDKENDILVWQGNEMWSTTAIFEHATQAEQQSKDADDQAVTVEVKPLYPTDTNGFSGRWVTKYDYYAGYMNVDLDINLVPNDSCDEYRCVWSSSDDLGTKGDAGQWCAHLNGGTLEGDTKMGGRKAHMYAFHSGGDRALSVIFSYGSDEYPPWRLEFTKR